MTVRDARNVYIGPDTASFTLSATRTGETDRPGVEVTVAPARVVNPSLAVSDPECYCKLL